ncbi:hypothetical protein [Salinibacter grassmerensis]|uniref:hypothetical protein n=1 Tax=Salinibacter grassmerensis TaxID=3040353 RepID=UPI0021E84F1B|nr:hypothetical protein [Salinibacter grassmerensis]
MPIEADSYFNLQEHRKYIPTDAGVNPENATEGLADRAEDLVLDYYTYTNGVGDRIVYLYEWEEHGLDDNPNEQEREFLQAYRRTVGSQLWWNLLKKDNNPFHESRSVGKESVSFDNELMQKERPPNFGKFLTEFDARPLI